MFIQKYPKILFSFRRKWLYVAWALALFVMVGENCESQTIHHTVYVSGTEGSDANDGRSISHPVKTIEKAVTLGDTLLLKAGDVFYECVVLRNQYMSRYGAGPDPEINGFRTLTGKPWVKAGENIWKIDLTKAASTGFVVSGTSKFNNVGCFYIPAKDELHGRKCPKMEELENDWDFFQADVLTYHAQGEKSFDNLYLYYKGNPNDFQMALSIGSKYGVMLHSSSIEKVSVKGFGTGGIRFYGTSVIRDCRVDMIGGSMMLYGRQTTSLGNGIDIYVQKDASDCVIEGCHITRCFDSGCSIQAEMSGKATPRNIVFRHNLIANCCQGWEDFLRNDDNVKYENCVFEENTVLNIGQTSGFGYPKDRFKYCHVLGNNFKGDKGMIIRNNTFVGGNYYCSGAYRDKYKSNVWEGNVCIIKRGDYILSNYMGTKDVIRIPTKKGDFKTLAEATEDAIRRYRELTGDETTRFVIKSDRKIKRCVAKLKKQFLKG